MPKNRPKKPVWRKRYIFIPFVLLLASFLVAFIFLQSEEKLYDDLASLPYADYEYNSTTPHAVYEQNNQILGIQEGLNLPIIMYHYIDYASNLEEGERRLSVAPSTLEAAIRQLQQDKVSFHYVRDIPQLMKQKNPGKVVFLTFDDGYDDFYTQVLPILKKYRVKATLYVINNYIGRKGFLNRQQLNTIIESGLVEVGAHTLDHSYLKTLSKKAALEEILASKQGLERELGVEVQTFAYPFGAYSADTVELVKQASFSAAVSVDPGIYQTKNDLFTLKRIRAGAFVGGTIEKVINGTYRPATR